MTRISVNTLAWEREAEAHLESLLIEGLASGRSDIPLTRKFWQKRKAEAKRVANRQRAVVRPN